VSFAKEAPLVGTPRVERDSYGKDLNVVVEIVFIMFAVMNSELQKHENIIVFYMIENLNTLYQEVLCLQDPLSKLICRQDDLIC
jgi:hypothetical protein